ncbi:hypothetical protein Y1Q_0019704 [Alligator mississippiensis]|uniref:Uncharacterized protein n=1 Tax=Alligator mississippiensis TaxID=8496 RepID=A0A151PET2_ALLMI|nr:hypothetical protein Y1Q_0019704 [Alligator mississippiensis]
MACSLDPACKGLDHHFLLPDHYHEKMCLYASHLILSALSQIQQGGEDLPTLCLLANKPSSPVRWTPVNKETP